jgi:sterol carrier protein 2
VTTGVHVPGVEMIPFRKPGKSASYSAMGEQVACAALTDAGLDYTRIKQTYVDYVYGDSTSNQSALYGLRRWRLDPCRWSPNR